MKGDWIKQLKGLNPVSLVFNVGDYLEIIYETPAGFYGKARYFRGICIAVKKKYPKGRCQYLLRNVWKGQYFTEIVIDSANSNILSIKKLRNTPKLNKAKIYRLNPKVTTLLKKTFKK